MKHICQLLALLLIAHAPLVGAVPTTATTNKKKKSSIGKTNTDPRSTTASTTGTQKPIRVLVSKLGLDGHDRGALVISRGLRDAGMEVIYSGLFNTPSQVVKTAIDEDVDVIGMSLLNGAHNTLFPKVSKLLKESGVDDVLVLGGGVVPKSDAEALKRDGHVHEVFGPGTPIDTIVHYIRAHVRGRK